MGLFDFIKREAKDLGDAADDVKDKFDKELTKREQELEMTPSEKIAALQQQASATDAKFDDIANKAAGRGSLADAVAEVGEIPHDPSLPNVTHIVLPDGRVRSGHDVGQVVDQSGTVHDVPLIEAPSAEDLQKADTPLPPAPIATPAAAPSTPSMPAAPEVPTFDDVAAQVPTSMGTPSMPAAPEVPTFDDVAAQVPTSMPATPEVRAAPEVPTFDDVAAQPPMSMPATPEVPTVDDMVGAVPPLPDAPEVPTFDDVVDGLPSIPAAPEVPTFDDAVTDLTAPPAPIALTQDPVAAPAPIALTPEPAADVPAPIALTPEPAGEPVLPAPPAPDPVVQAPDLVAEVAEPVAPEPVAEVSQPAPAAPIETAEPAAVDTSDPAFGKTPAQLKYERARAAANDLLDELRGELKDDGEI